MDYIVVAIATLDQLLKQENVVLEFLDDAQEEARSVPPVRTVREVC